MPRACSWPTPFVDKTVYVNWNAMCVSAYLQAAQVLGLENARKFALCSLDRILSEAWDAQRGLAHVIAYSGAKGAPRLVRGLLDDYAFTALARLDAYEVTGDMSYFKFAQQIADEMLHRFGDATSGGFFDTEATLEDKLKLGALSARRKPFQDAPTPAGNPSAAIALEGRHPAENYQVGRGPDREADRSQQQSDPRHQTQHHGRVGHERRGQSAGGRAVQFADRSERPAGDVLQNHEQ